MNTVPNLPATQGRTLKIMDWFKIKINTIFLIKELYWGREERDIFLYQREDQNEKRPDRWRTHHRGIHTQTTILSKKTHHKTPWRCCKQIKGRNGSAEAQLHNNRAQLNSITTALTAGSSLKARDSQKSRSREIKSQESNTSNSKLLQKFVFKR